MLDCDLYKNMDAKYSPLLGAVPALKERHGDEDDDCLATVADLDL